MYVRVNTTSGNDQVVINFVQIDVDMAEQLHWIVYELSAVKLKSDISFTHCQVKETCKRRENGLFEKTQERKTTTFL